LNIAVQLIINYYRGKIVTDLEQATKDYADDMEKLDSKIEDISGSDREGLINESFTDSQGCY
jgi:hypothetical protein